VSARPVCASIADAIGSTPLVSVRRFVGDAQPDCFFKLEYCNPTGSSKDRAAVAMLRAEERSGALKPGATVIVSSSGNMAVALASLCVRGGYQLVCVVDPKISQANVRLLRVLNAVVVRVDEQDAFGGYHVTRLAKARELAKRLPGAVYIDQYDNAENVGAHYRATAREIWEALGERLAAVVIAAGTGGTLIGCAEFFRELDRNIDVWAVDEYGSLALPTSKEPQPRLLNGMGASVRPANYPYARLEALLRHQVHVNAEQALSAALDLARTEGIIAGGTGGAVAHVIRSAAARMYGPGRCIVGILPDHGSRYTDTFYDDSWLAERGLSVRVGEQRLP
jgi:N-(2-amino-2-carboxyethyl)-L-glutamate synthase